MRLTIKCEYHRVKLTCMLTVQQKKKNNNSSSKWRYWVGLFVKLVVKSGLWRNKSCCRMYFVSDMISPSLNGVCDIGKNDGGGGGGDGNGSDNNSLFHTSTQMVDRSVIYVVSFSASFLGKVKRDGKWAFFHYDQWSSAYFTPTKLKGRESIFSYLLFIIINLHQLIYWAKTKTKKKI